MKLKKFFFALTAFLIFSALVSPAVAANFLTDENNGNITVTSGETYKNLYTAGNMVTIDGNIERSMYAAGNIITMNGNVENDANIAGGTLLIRGQVGGSAHLAGGNLVIDSAISDDLFIAGGNITLTSKASIGGDLLIAGGTVDIQSPVTGNLFIRGGEVTINSKVEGITNIEVGNLSIGSQAEIMQDLVYRASQKANIADGATILGAIDYQQSQVNKINRINALKNLFGILTFAFLMKILIYIVTGLILVLLFNKLVEPVVKDGLKNFWPSLGIGFAALILIPLICIILLITVIGSMMAGFLGILYALFLILALPLGSIVFGSWLIKLFNNKKTTYQVDWQAVVVGVILLSIISLIPIFGWLIAFIFMLIALGALYRQLSFWTKTKGKK